MRGYRDLSHGQIHGEETAKIYIHMSCVAAQRWEMHLKSTGAPTRPSAALVALRAWAGINRKARHFKIVPCPPCLHATLDKVASRGKLFWVSSFPLVRYFD